jgi:hypothetical protein
MNLLFNPSNLENLLIKKWTEFVDLKKVINIASSTVEQQFGYSPPNIQNLKVTRFDIVNYNFVIWIECIIKNKTNDVNITIEIITNLNGEITKVSI